MSESFTKLFSSITDSTIWMEDDTTRIVWVTMLAMADQNGYVGASIPGIAARARVPLEAAVRALEKFQQPDEYSRSQEFDGRRIEQVDRGWVLLNHKKFRELRNIEARRESNRRSQRKRRQSGKTLTGADSQQECAQAEAEAEAEERGRARASAPPPPTTGDTGSAAGETTPALVRRFYTILLATIATTPAWSADASKHVATIAGWADSMPDPKRALQMLFTAFEHDEWARGKRWPISVLAKQAPQLYAKALAESEA